MCVCELFLINFSQQWQLVTGKAAVEEKVAASDHGKYSTSVSFSMRNNKDRTNDMDIIPKSKESFSSWLIQHLCAANDPYIVNVYAVKAGLQSYSK